MRLLLVHRFGHRIGGIESYLHDLIPALTRRGDEVAFLFQEPLPPDAQPIAPVGLPSWGLDSIANPASLVPTLRAFRPDAVYAHQLVTDTVLHPLQSLPDAVPVYFAHCYLGVCISSLKCWKWPTPKVCQRVLGWGCLLHYFPHRCGGLNPLVMWRLFREQRTAQTQLRRFRWILTHSDAVRQEYLRHGFAPDQIRKIPFWIPDPRPGCSVGSDPGSDFGSPSPAALTSASEPRSTSPSPVGPALPATGPLRLLFLGRHDWVKGGQRAIDALPQVARALRRELELTLAGTGPEQAAWQTRAQTLMARHPEISIRFPGWLSGPDRHRALAETHLVVAPSLWPEPFGMTGLEGGFFAKPAVAYDVGGVREWLVEGVNGHLAPAHPPTADALARAILRCLSDPDHYRDLAQGAQAAALRFNVESHLAALDAVLHSAPAARGP